MGFEKRSEVLDSQGNQIKNNTLKLTLDSNDCHIVDVEARTISCGDIDIMLGRNDETAKDFNLIQADVARYP